MLSTLATCSEPERARWIDTLPAPAQEPVRRALRLDRRIWAKHPASLPSLLLLRTHGLPGLAALRRSWIAALEASEVPWVEPLRGAPLPVGLCAELHPEARPRHIRFASEGVVLLQTDDASPRLLRWRWTDDTTSEAPAADLSPRRRDPRITHPMWGPSYFAATPDAEPVPLPCPEGGTARAELSEDASSFLVYGSHDEYDGGFAYGVDAATLQIRWRQETRSPVDHIITCARPDTVLIVTSGAKLLRQGGTVRRLPLPGSAVALSPDASHVLTMTPAGGLRVWHIDSIEPTPADDDGFRAQFSPDGRRLLCGRRLLDSHTGAEIARLGTHFGSYLEGGPAQPSMHLGTRYLINLHARLQVWDTERGALQPRTSPIRFPQWFKLAYDRAGQVVVAMRHGQQQVVAHPIPGGPAQTVVFSAGCQAIAVSPDGAHIAAASRDAVEIRSRDGALVRRLHHPTPPGTDTDRSRYDSDVLRYSADGGRLASRIGASWWVWDLSTGEGLPEDGLDEAPGFAQPGDADWRVTADGLTRLTHLPSGAEIVLPLAGPWVCCPLAPAILASQHAHLVLRS